MVYNRPVNFIQQIFLKLATLLGLELQPKEVGKDDYTCSEILPITGAIANKIATLSLMDSSIKVIGDSENATYLDELLRDYLMERINVACEVALGTGDCLIKPYTDGYRIGVDIIKNEDFVVCESIGNFIKSVIIKTDEVKQDMDVYQRFETQILKKVKDEAGRDRSVLIIRQNAFKNGDEIPLSMFSQWAGLEKELIISDMDYLLLGRIKSPTVNRDNVNGINGVKITYGLDNVIDKVIESYNRFNQEFADKETMIFANKTLFKKDESGNLVLPKGKKRLFMKFKPAGDNFNVDTFSPQIRDDSLEKAVDFNLKIIEIMAGLSAGILTAPNTNFATATEMKASLQSTFAYITKFRNFIEAGINQLIYSITVLADINNIINKLGGYEIAFDWSSSYVEQLNEQFNRLMQAHSIGAIDEAEVRAFVLDEDYQKAKERVEEIVGSQPDLME